MVYNNVIVIVIVVPRTVNETKYGRQTRLSSQCQIKNKQIKRINNGPWSFGVGQLTVTPMSRNARSGKPQFII